MVASLFGTGGAINVTANGTLVPQSFVATAGQTVFTLTAFTYVIGSNSLLVWINGQKQTLTRDYTESSTTTFTLLEGCVAGDFVDVIGFPETSLSTLNASSAVYTPPGTGGLTTTVGAVLDRNLNIAEYGTDQTAVQNAIDAADSKGCIIYVAAGTYTFSSPASLKSGVVLIGVGDVIFQSTTPGSPCLIGNALSRVTVENIQFTGVSPVTVPVVSVGGFAASSSGLLTIANSTDVEVTKCQFSSFYNGLSLIKCVRVWATKNYVTNWALYGILGSLCSDYSIDSNVIVGCAQTGAFGAYGISATGDRNGGTVQKAGSISWNMIRDVPSWDGIMTHDCNGLRLIGNDIRNVRNGLDIGSVNATTTSINVEISGNYIEATTIDTWAGAAAAHLGILFTGFNAGTLSDTVSIVNNIISGFYAITGTPAFAGTSAHIGCAYANFLNIQGNIIKNGGTVSGAPGIAITGNANIVSIDGNTLQGKFSSGAIRLANVVGSSVTITGNTVLQTTTTDISIYATSCTLDSLEVSGNVGNSTAPYSESGNTITAKSVNAGHIRYTGTFSVTALANATGTGLAPYTVPGAVTGDLVHAFCATAGVIFTGYVSGANTVAMTCVNFTGGALTLAGAAITIDVTKFR